MKWISPEDWMALEAAQTVELIDVREPWEYEVCNIGHVNIPMGMITTVATGLDKTKPYLILCKTGRRAEAVANMLERDYGFSNISVLQGGITAWYAATDPTYEIY